MVRVNMAKDILTDPDARRAYDEVRAQRADAGARVAWGKRAADVRRQAEAYPRKWADFERWMHSVADDIRRAEYGKTQAGIATFPTAGRSVSGWAFIVIGALLGGVLGIIVLSGVPAPSQKILFFLAVAGGAWVGTTLHKFLRAVMGSGDDG
jgi:hypothetical protein